MLVIAGCAQQVMPSGGEKDEVPPRILESDPINESTNFDGKSISMEFDEYVALKNATQELIVSPPLKYPVEFKMKNKQLTLSWKDTLEDNTTYLFQFGKGISDVNEGNVLDSNVFVFSTGSYLDSFELKGSVIDAFDLKPVEEVWVMLYSTDEDSLPYKELPRYFSKTDKQGQFHLRYLRPGNYKCFALKPNNSGYLFDIPDEAIAFLQPMIAAQNPADSLGSDTAYTLRLFVQEDSTQYIKSFAQIGNQGIELVFNRPVETIEISEIGGKDITGWTDSWSANRDSIAYWFEAPDTYDSLKIDITVEGLRDTVFFRKPSTAKASRRTGKRGAKEGDGLQLTATTGKLSHFKPFVATSVTPIASMDLSRSVFTENGDTVPFESNVVQDFYGFTLDYPWKQEGNYSLMIPDSSIADRYGQYNDTIKWLFSATRKEDFGQLLIRHQLPENGHPFVWQLIKADGKILDERVVQAKGTVSYDFLPTGKYQVRIMFDYNANGQWDTGYYPGKRQPERVVYFEQQFEIRSNWATELDWNLQQ